MEALTLFNETCQAVRHFDEVQMKQLAMVVEFTGFSSHTEVTSLAKLLGEFEVNPFVHNDEEYGKYMVEESGLFDVDELLLPHINYASFAADKRQGTLVTSGYVEDGFVGATRELSEYQQYNGEFADPLEIDESCYETFRLYSPLTAGLYEEGFEQGKLYRSDLTPYAEEIAEAIEKEYCVGEEPRGLMHYFDRSPAVAAKVMSAHPKVDIVDGELYGVLECKIAEALTEHDIEVLKEYWTGQMSDGWGEGFEQHPITVEDGEIYVSFWNSENFWSVMTEEELMGGQVQGMNMSC